MIDLEFVRKVFDGDAKKKERAAGADQLEYIINLIGAFAARVRFPNGEVYER